MAEENYTPSWDIGRRCLNPLIELRETEDEVIVTADLPCVDKENIEITAEEKTLTIKAEMRKDIQFKSWGGAHRKVRFNSFRRRVSLPAIVDTDEAEATFKRGILEVRLRKRKGSKIKIQ